MACGDAWIHGPDRRRPDKSEHVSHAHESSYKTGKIDGLAEACFFPP